jgi:hypothetical protein
VTLKEFVKLIFAICLTAEFGFLGDMVVTFVTTPLSCGFFFNAGVLDKLIFL